MTTELTTSDLFDLIGPLGKAIVAAIEALNEIQESDHQVSTEILLEGSDEVLARLRESYRGMKLFRSASLLW